MGLHRWLRLDARAPIGDLVEALNAFQPQGLNAYPSIAALLAERQLAGELRIAPELVATSGEVLTAEMKKQILAAFGRTPFNGYGATEAGYIAVECDRHAGLHVFEDQVQLEVVDDEYRPVPPGEPGSRLLVTNLFNRTQPLIRYELNDLVTVSPDPCPCGRPSRLLETVGGRSDDVLEMPAAEGGAGTDGAQTCGEIETGLGAALAERGVQVPPILVESVADIPRHPHSGKHKAIEVQAA